MNATSRDLAYMSAAHRALVEIMRQFGNPDTSDLEKALNVVGSHARDIRTCIDTMNRAADRLEQLSNDIADIAKSLRTALRPNTSEDTHG